MADIPPDDHDSSDHDSSDHDSDEDVEFVDVPRRIRQPVQAEIPAAHVSDRPSDHIGPVAATIAWVPPLNIPPQRQTPYASGSSDEIQLRGRLSEALDRIEFRQMKTQMGRDLPANEHDHITYKSVQELAYDIEDTADMLWSSATPSVQVEGIISLAGTFQRALRTYRFDAVASLTILNKLDYYLASLIEGKDVLSQAPLPGATPDRPLVTQTQRVRIRSIAESSRTQLFAAMPSSGDSTDADMDEDEDEDGAVGQEDQDGNEPADLDLDLNSASGYDDWEEPEFPSWMVHAARVYERVLMLTGD